MGRTQISSFVVGGGLLLIALARPNLRADPPSYVPPESQDLEIATAELLDRWEDLEQYLVLLCMVLDCDLNRSGTAAQASPGAIEAAALQLALTYETRGLRQNLSFDERLAGCRTVSRVLRILLLNPDRMSPLIRDRFAADLVCLRAELEQ